jgi:hypothetical protein
MITGVKTVAQSVDLDTRFLASNPNDPRWDYVVKDKATPSSPQTGIGIEVHPAENPRNANEMIAKAAWAKAICGEHEPDLALRAWCWIASGRIKLNKTSGTRRLLAQNGLSFPTKHLDLS